METKKRLVKKEDILGVNVLDFNGVRIGRLADLVEDSYSDSKRFIEVAMDPEFYEDREERHILIPSGLATFDEVNHCVIISELEPDSIFSCPVYTKGESVAEYEHALLEVLVPQPGKIARNPDDFFHFEHSDADNFYNKKG